MARENNSPKITSYRRYSWLNIGTLLFGSILIYMIITVIIYLRTEHVTSYEVTAGSISGNYRYTALALKTETIETAPYSGYVTYYSRGGTRTGSGSVICSISDDPEYLEISSDVELTDSDYAELKTSLKFYSLNQVSGAFPRIYTLRSELENYIFGVFSDASADDVNIYLSNAVFTSAAGFVVYQTDGMETLTEADLDESLFNLNNYSPANLRTETAVSFGDPLYKLIEGEDWYLYFPVSSDLAASLTGRESMRFRFLKDDTTFSSAFTIVENTNGYFGKLTLHNSLVRYVSDRFLDIELLMDSQSGLKVPASAISEKVFYLIPSDYVTVNEDDSSEVSFIKVTYRSDGSQQEETVTTNAYDHTDEGYLISTDLLANGDYIRQSGTDKRFTVTEEDLTAIQGVYNINKGYAEFRRVNIIDQNEEFCVVEPNNLFGLAAHDYIVLDASQVDDDEIIYG